MLFLPWVKHSSKPHSSRPPPAPLPGNSEHSGLDASSASWGPLGGSEVPKPAAALHPLLGKEFLPPAAWSGHLELRNGDITSHREWNRWGDCSPERGSQRPHQARLEPGPDSQLPGCPPSPIDCRSGAQAGPVLVTRESKPQHCREKLFGKIPAFCRGEDTLGHTPWATHPMDTKDHKMWPRPQGPTSHRGPLGHHAPKPTLHP